MTSVDDQAIFHCDLCYGGLSIGGVQLLNEFGAWCCPDLSPLWGNPDQRGSDALLPGASGVRAFPRRDTYTEHDLVFWCSGQVDGLSGNTAAENGTTPEGQLALNMAYLRDNVFAPIGAGTGTRPAVWTPPGVGPISADVRAVLPSDTVQLLPKGVLRGTITVQDPYALLHL